jgi:histidine triad (HIT) family protein
MGTDNGGKDDKASHGVALLTMRAPWQHEAYLITICPLVYILNLLLRLRPNPFLKILAEKLPADYYHRDETCICFRDIYPAARFHALVVPRKRFRSWKELMPSDLPLLRHMMQVARKVAEEQAVTNPRFSFQTPPFNTVFQLHLHIMSQPLTEKGIRQKSMESSWAVTPEYVEQLLVSRSLRTSGPGPGGEEGRSRL